MCSFSTLSKRYIDLAVRFLFPKYFFNLFSIYSHEKPTASTIPAISLWLSNGNEMTQLNENLTEITLRIVFTKNNIALIVYYLVLLNFIFYMRIKWVTIRRCPTPLAIFYTSFMWCGWSLCDDRNCQTNYVAGWKLTEVIWRIFMKNNIALILITPSLV